MLPLNIQNEAIFLLSTFPYALLFVSYSFSQCLQMLASDVCVCLCLVFAFLS